MKVGFEKGCQKSDQEKRRPLGKSKISYSNSSYVKYSNGGECAARINMEQPFASEQGG